MVVFYILFGGVSGFISARIYKMCGGQGWRRNILFSTFLVPGCLFGILITINFFFIFNKSSGALPFGTLFALLVMWFFLSAPLSIVGAYIGFKKNVMQMFHKGYSCTSTNHSNTQASPRAGIS
jgi:transmembrane 9 superfamily protein 2/4